MVNDKLNKTNQPIGNFTERRRKQMIKRRYLWVGLVSLLSLFISAQVFAQEDVIKERRNLMKSNNKASKAIGKAIKKSDFAIIEEKAKVIAANMKKVPDLFPEGSTSKKSRAKAAIWEKWDSFKEKRSVTMKAANALAKAAAAKDLDLVKAERKGLKCGSCHKAFRKTKKRKKK